MKKLNFISKIIYLLNSVFATLLIFAFALPYIAPKTFPSFSILSILVPALIVINILFAIYWIISLKKQFFLSTFILILGWLFTSPYYKFTSTNSALNNDLKFMSYNVRLFNHYKWTKEENIDKKIINFIKEKDPDVIALQEYFKTNNKQLSYPYQYVETKNKNAKFGMAILSKYPILNKGSLNLKNTSNNIIFADIVKNNDTIRVYNLHLQSLQLKADKENFGQENSEKLIF